MGYNVNDVFCCGNETITIIKLLKDDVNGDEYLCEVRDTLEDTAYLFGTTEKEMVEEKWLQINS